MSDRRKNGGRPNYRTIHRRIEQQPLEKKYYDNADMMQLFNVSGRTLQRWRDELGLPYKKIGGKVFYLPDEVDEFVRQQGEG